MKKETSTAREISPDALMSDFRGRPVMSILTFTVIAHLLFIGFFSLGYLRNQVFGESNSSLSEEERLDQAMEEATRSLRKIAERHGIQPQDLSEQFANRSSGSSKSSPPGKKPPISPETATQPVAQPRETSMDSSDSAIEKELKKKAKGPDLPSLNPIEDEDDLFK